MEDIKPVATEKPELQKGDESKAKAVLVLSV